MKKTKKLPLFVTILVLVVGCIIFYPYRSSEVIFEHQRPVLEPLIPSSQNALDTQPSDTDPHSGVMLMPATPTPKSSWRENTTIPSDDDREQIGVGPNAGRFVDDILPDVSVDDPDILPGGRYSFN